MKLIRPLRCLPLMASLVLALSAVSASAADAARVIVKFKASTNSQVLSAASSAQAATRHAQALSQRTGLALTDGRVINSHLQVVRATGLNSAQLAARLAKESDVEYALVDQRRHAAAAPNDPRYPAGQLASTPAVGQWYLRAPTATAVSAINAEGAWAQTTGAGVVVAVLDTGVRFEHPDLAVKLYPGYDFVIDAAIANDGNARDSNASDPGDWVTSAEVSAGGDFADCTAEDSSWHGTQTAGLIGAAANNGIGMAGVGGDVMILPLRVLGKCGGYDSDITAAMLWAVGQHVPGVPDNTHPAKVLNLSLGSTPTGSCPQYYVDAIAAANAAGAVVVVSAGNDGLAVNVPAMCPGAIAVAGVRHSGTKVGYSSLGSQVSISAPAGNCVTVGVGDMCQYPLLTTVNSGTTGASANSTYTDAINPSLGTSFSAPMVAGTAALMFSAKPSITPTEVLAALKNSARVFPTPSGVASCHAPAGVEQDECACTASTCGAGLLDTSAAVAAVATTVGNVIPVISFDTSAANPGASFTLDSVRTVLPTGRTVQTYAWSVVSGGSYASITSANNAATVTLLGVAKSTVVIRLSVTDDLNAVTTRDVSIAVGGPPAASDVSTLISRPSNSGGGALGLHWLLGLTMAIVVLAERNRRLRLQKTRPLAARRLLTQ